MSLLRFYPGATPGKEGNKLKMMMKKQKKKRPDSKFSSKLQTEQSTPANIIFDTQTDINLTNQTPSLIS
jgi:hypothetical protein